MIKIGDDSGFTLKTEQEFAVMHEIGVHDLDGDITIQAFLIRLIDRRHTARADLFYDFVRSYRLYIWHYHAIFYL
jgi:hypothetical protein